MKSPQQRRILIDLYETNLTQEMLTYFVAHIERLRDKIVKLGIATDISALKTIRKGLQKGCSLGKAQLYFSTDMEETKTWLVSDKYYS